MRGLLLLAVVAPLALAAPIPKDFKKKWAEYLPLAVGYKREYVSPDDPDTVTEVREVTAVEEKDGFAGSRVGDSGCGHDVIVCCSAARGLATPR